MKIAPEIIVWMSQTLEEVRFGEVGLIFHMRDGKIEWTEKIKRETEKPKSGVKA